MFYPHREDDELTDQLFQQMATLFYLPNIAIDSPILFELAHDNLQDMVTENNYNHPFLVV